MTLRTQITDKTKSKLYVKTYREISEKDTFPFLIESYLRSAGEAQPRQSERCVDIERNRTPYCITDETFGDARALAQNHRLQQS